MPKPKSKAIVSSSDESDSSSSATSSSSASSSSSEDFRPAHVKSGDLQKLTVSQKSSRNETSQKETSQKETSQKEISQKDASQKFSQKISQKSSKSETKSKSKSKSKNKPETTSASPEKRKKPEDTNDSDDSDIENIVPKKKQKKEATVVDKTKYQVQLGTTGKKYVRYSYFKSRHYIDIRELYEDKSSGELKPTKKGIMLMSDMAIKVLSLFDKVDAQLNKVQAGKESDGMIPVMNNIYFKVYKFKKMVLVDLRNYYDAKGEQKPGKGIALTVAQYEALKDEEANIRKVIDDCY